MFNYMSLCQEVARVGLLDVVFGVPLYSDLADVHDAIVRTAGAFDQTIRGIMNLKRCGQRVEIRTVILRANMNRLADLAYFIGRNLPFAEHVALMSLEPMGFARSAIDALWVPPSEYELRLAAAVDELASHRIGVSIYNLPLCLLSKRLWPYAVQSISDWKTAFFAECGMCAVRGQCGGVFESATGLFANSIRPVP
jgi:His-Xaa-Ser system radical SAM maturase HxsC